MTTFKEGDYARFTYEGRIESRVWEDQLKIGDAYIEFGGSDVTVHLTKIPSPEPKWQKGDVVFDAELGHTMMHTGSARWSCTCLHGASEPVAHIAGKWKAGKLVHLVRDGKPVTS